MIKKKVIIIIKMDTAQTEMKCEIKEKQVKE